MVEKLAISPEKTENLLCTQKKSNTYRIPEGGIKIKKSVSKVTAVDNLGLFITVLRGMWSFLTCKENVLLKMNRNKQQWQVP